MTAAVIDGPIADGDRAGLVPLVGLALVFGIAEAALFFLRRWAMNRSCLQIERDLRDALYDRLQRLPVAFHDRWASGAAALPRDHRRLHDPALRGLRRRVPGGQPGHLRRRPRAADGHLLAAGPGRARHHLPLTVLGLRWERRYNVQSRLVQDEQGELTTDVEEAVQGIRVVKSPRPQRAGVRPLRRQGHRLRRLELDKVRTLALLWCIFEFHPQITLASSWSAARSR